MFNLVLAFCWISMIAGEIPPTETYPTSAILDPDSMVKLYWKADEVNITFELHINTTGWVGMGISPNGGMAKSDIVVGWVKDGKANITDRHGTDVSGYPPMDPQQNVELIAGEERDGWTMIKYQRLLVSCEPGVDLPVTKDTLKIIYAFGVTDPEGEDIIFSDYHGTHKGVKSLILLDAQAVDGVVFPEGEIHSTFDLLNSDFEIPAETTYYNCRLFKIPTFTKKQHVVKVEPIIHPGNEQLVHHMLVYQCTNNVIESESVGTNTRCYGSDMPPDFQSCTVAFHAWAIGGGTFYYPTHTGFPLGEDDSPKYVTIEMHYDNPEAKAGVIDSSGLRFTYTEQLRDHDAAVFEAGHIVAVMEHIIPPNAESFFDYGDCSEQCLSGAMDLGEVDHINVFSVILHSHLVGEGMAVRHIRGTTELPYLVKDEAYDFNYQEVRTLSEERTIHKGDSLQTVCKYRTKGVRDEFTAGGLDTTREMCLGFVFYYPKIPMTFCQTSPRSLALKEYFGIEEIESLVNPMTIYNDLDDFMINAPENISGQTYGHFLNAMEWNEDTVDKLSVDLRDMARMQYCLGPSGYLPGAKYYIPAIEVTVPYVEEPFNCSAAAPVTSSAPAGHPITTGPATFPTTTVKTTTQKSSRPVVVTEQPVLDTTNGVVKPELSRLCVVLIIAAFFFNRSSIIV